MDTRIAARSYEDIEPTFEWKQEEDCDTLVISIPGFNKEQLKLQLDNFGNLKLSGERPLTGDRWCRVRNDFRIPDNSSTADIRAKFEKGNLHVRFPKLFAKSQDQTPKAKEHEPSSKTMAEPKPSEDQDRVSQVGAAKNAQTIQKEKKDQNHMQKAEDNKNTSDADDQRDAELVSLRKRKAAVEDETPAASERGVGMRFKKPRHLMVNVGVALVILLGLGFYVTYKLSP